MNKQEWELLENEMTQQFQTIYGIDLHHLCEVDGMAKPMRFHVGYDAAGIDCREYEFCIEVPQAVYQNSNSYDIAKYIVNCFKMELNENGGIEAFEAPTENTAVWCDEI